MGKILYEESEYNYNENYPVSFKICFTEEKFFSLNNYYKAFLVEDMYLISGLLNNISNFEKLNINECINILLFFHH